MIEDELQDALKEMNRVIPVPPTASRVLNIDFRDLFERAIKEIQLLRTIRQTGEELMVKLIEDELQDILSRAPAGDDVFVSRVLLERAVKEIEHMRLSAGAVTSGESFDDIAKRTGRQPKDA